MSSLWRLAAVLLVVCLASGCLRRQAQPKDYRCGEMTRPDERSRCLYNQSFELSNPSFCKNIPDSDIKARCIDDIAVKLKDEYSCIQHDRLPLREECERKVALAKRLSKD